MGREHIDFASWEPGASLDEEHLNTCADCRESLELARFLRSQVEQVPRLDAPPFFAARVAAMVRSDGPDPVSFWLLVERAAKSLIPGFAVLVLMLFFFTAETPRDQPSDEELWAALFAEPQIREVATLDDVLLSLRDTLEEDGESRN